MSTEFKPKDPKVVGRIHYHDLPATINAKLDQVYRCHCGKELFIEENPADKKRTWYSIDDSPYSVEYDTHDQGEPEIGRWSVSLSEQVARDKAAEESAAKEETPVVVEETKEEAPAEEEVVEDAGTGTSDDA